MGDGSVQGALIIYAANKFDGDIRQALDQFRAAFLTLLHGGGGGGAGIFKRLDLFCGWIFGESVGQKVIARVSRLDLDHIANQAQIFNGDI